MKQCSPRFALLLALSIPSAAQAATLTVNSLADDTIAGDGLVTLREAITAAEVDGTTDLGQNGADADVVRVTLDGTITLLTPLPKITTAITVIGNGVDRLSITGDSMGGMGQWRVFDVRGGALALDSLTIAAGMAFGFRGGDCQQWSGCGGGSAALGGLVAVNPGSLTVTHARLSAGAVIGGNGGSHTAFVEEVHGGGGGAGLGGPGATPTSESGGTGGPAATGGSATSAGGNGVDGAGGGGGTSGSFGSPRGGNGGFGAGGGGGGLQTSPLVATGGSGGYGAGGGGRGGLSNQEVDAPGGNGGTFGGVGGRSSIPIGGSFPIGVGGGGGGGAGLGGCVFARNAQVEIVDTEFVDCHAFGGHGGANNTLNLGGSGEGKGGAVFLDSSVHGAILANVRFNGSIASGSSGNGFTPGAPSDTSDVFGTAYTALFADGFE